MPRETLVITPPQRIAHTHCGYCNAQKDDHYALESQAKLRPWPLQLIVLGAHLEQVTAADYAEFMSQGYRRLGSFLYKPDLLHGCCRLYTIRTNLSFLVATKEIRQVINRFARAVDALLPPPRLPKHARFDVSCLVGVETSLSRFRTRFEPSVFTPEKFDLYRRYQLTVHNDKPHDVTPESFKRFLCDSPFPQHQIEGTLLQWHRLNEWTHTFQKSPSQPQKTLLNRLGPAHECYYFDDKLIAVSVMDFLPCGILSIYFIWDPDYAHLLLGTLLGLRELLLCHHLGLEHYYLGYYTTDCPKMRYKLRFGGEILDLCNEVYVPLAKVSLLIETGRLFTMGISLDLNDGIGHERRLDNSGKPSAFESSPFANQPLYNIAEQIYGMEAQQVAETAKSVLLRLHGVNLDLDASDPFKRDALIPLVCPGITPLWQILDMFEAGTLGPHLRVRLFRPSRLRIEVVSFKECSPAERSQIIDCVRLFGLNKTLRAILIMS